MKKLAYSSAFKTKIMAYGPITSWQIEGEKVETVTDFLFSGFKITADGDCSHKIKILAPWKKIYDKPRQCIKSKDINFAKKSLQNQSYGFSSSYVGCDSWTLKKAEHRGVDAFEL